LRISVRQVIAALRHYQNPDGGFGNALEPDNWNKDSSPYTTLYATNALEGIGFCDYSHQYIRMFCAILEA
jgi:hypothetical protein